MSKHDALVGEDETTEPIQEAPKTPVEEGPAARDTWYREERQGRHHSVVHLPFKPTRDVEDHIEKITGITWCSRNYNGHKVEFRSAEVFDHERVLARVLEYLGGVHLNSAAPETTEGLGEDWFLSVAASLFMMIPVGFVLFMMLVPQESNLKPMVLFLLGALLAYNIGHQLYIRRTVRELKWYRERPKIITSDLGLM